MKRRLATLAWLSLATVPLAAAPRRYSVDPSQSEVRIAVGRAGLFKFAGHEHEVAAGSFSGTVLADPEALSASSVSLRFETLALRLTGKGEPPGDVATVQEKMAGPQVLDVERFPEIAFVSRSVTGERASDGRFKLELSGELRLRGMSRLLRFPLTVELQDDLLTAQAVVEIKQTDFGIKPVSVAGVVKVKNELVVSCRIVARASP